VNEHFDVTAGVTNLFNAMPPLDTTYQGTSEQPFNINDYNNYGRAFQLSAHYKTH
jgi:outer membrane receptor protein involved in Fe transport